MMCNTLINVESEKNIPIEIELDGIIDISDSEDELPPSERRFNRPLPGQRSDENWSNLKEDSPLSSTRKRRWVSATGSSEQGIEEDIIMKKFNAHKDENHKRFSLTMCSRIPNASFGGQHVEENKSSTEGETLNHLQTSGSLHEKVGNTFMGDTENVLEDVRSNGESENYGAHMVKGDFHLDDNQIKLIQGNQSNWKFVADMLSSFEEDPELSMKAVCALCRQQTLQEKSEQDPLGYNAKRGFSAFYVIRGTEIAAFLMDGDREGGIKKSIEMLNLWDHKALEECKMLARIHSSQLFRIYKAKEDPFFLPSSAN